MLPRQLACVGFGLVATVPLLAQTPIRKSPIPISPTPVRTLTPVAPAGPAVANLQIGPTAITAQLRWSPATGATQYKLYRSGPKAPLALVATIPTTSNGYYVDTGLYPSTSYSYEMSAVYAAGEGLHSSVVSITTLAGAPPATLKATVTGAGTVSLSWPPADEAAAYEVWRDGRLLNNTVSGTSFQDSSVPPGSYTYTVGSMLQPMAGRGLVEGQLTNLPSAQADVAYGIYSLLLERINVTQKTSDNALDGDGKGDEVFFTADLTMVTNGAAGALPQQQVRTWTYGDVNNQSNRQQAGSGSLKGGIESGDQIPGNTPANAVCNPWPPDHYCMPLEIFRGQLVKDNFAVRVIPTIWEYDGPTDLFNKVVAWHVTTSQAVSSSQSFAKQFPTAKPYVDISAMAFGHVALFTKGVLALGEGDRPVGIADTANNQIVYHAKVVPLSYELAESLLSGTFRVGTLMPGEFQIQYRDGSGYQGDYTLTFLVKKCASMTGPC